jgi:tripeptide aminopeptidase
LPKRASCRDCCSHGDIRVAFTPDEEVGKGAKHFDVEAFNAHWAYTVDGGGVGELEFENFNAASVNIRIVGNNVHPGTAKGVMVNALSLAARIHAEVPAEESPEQTEGYEGFYHLTSIKGTVDRADMHYIIRDFNREGFEARKRKIMDIAKKVGKGLHPDCYIELVIEDSYYNMREKVVAHPYILDVAQQAMRDCDIEPQLKPIRGGTDGAQLSFMGLPCPNLFTGGYNYHGKHEFVTIQMFNQLDGDTGGHNPVCTRFNRGRSIGVNHHGSVRMRIAKGVELINWAAQIK